jgi:hypothetical protein
MLILAFFYSTFSIFINTAISPVVPSDSLISVVVTFTNRISSTTMRLRRRRRRIICRRDLTYSRCKKEKE